MSKQWNAMVKLEETLNAVVDLGTVSIGLEEDLFHQNKFEGHLPAAFIEWRGDVEEGADDGDETRRVPFTLTVTVIWKMKSDNESRREKIKDALAYSELIKNAVDNDGTLGGYAEFWYTRIGESRLSDRLDNPYAGVEIDVNAVVRETKGSR